jgi:hypothetical protein
VCVCVCVCVCVIVSSFHVCIPRARLSQRVSAMIIMIYTLEGIEGKAMP